MDDVEFLETELYENLNPGKHQMKVAKLVAMTFGGKTITSEEAVNAALERLVQRTDIQSFGNIGNWRQSEIRRLDKNSVGQGS